MASFKSFVVRDEPLTKFGAEVDSLQPFRSQTSSQKIFQVTIGGIHEWRLEPRVEDSWHCWFSTPGEKYSQPIGPREKNKTKNALNQPSLPVRWSKYNTFQSIIQADHYRRTGQERRSHEREVHVSVCVN